MNLVIWRTFVWLFGALLFGYLAHYLLDYHVNQHRYHHQRHMFYQVFGGYGGILMSLWICMIEEFRILLVEVWNQ